MNILSFFLILLNLYIIFFEFQKRSISLIFWIGNFIYFSFPNFFSILISNTAFNASTYFLATTFSILFNLLYLIVRLFLAKKRSYHLIKHNIVFYKRHIFLISFILLIFFVSFLITYVQLGGFSNSNWGTFLSFFTTGGYLNIHLYISYFFYSFSGLILVFFLKKKFILLLITSMILLSIALLTNTKQMFSIFIIIFLLPISILSTKKIDFKLALQGLTLFFSGIFVVSFLYLLRKYSNIFVLLNTISLDELFAELGGLLFDFNAGEFSLKNAFYLFIQNNNNFPNFSRGHTYIRFLLFFLPTQFSFGLKPPDFAVSMGSAVLNDYTNTVYSMHPTFYGDLFANFWYFGIIIAIVYAWAFEFLERFIEKKDPFIQSFLIFSISIYLLMLARGSVYNSLFLITLSIIIQILINGIFKFYKMRKKRFLIRHG